MTHATLRTHPAVTNQLDYMSNNKHLNEYDWELTIKDAFDVDRKHVIPPFLFWKVGKRTSPCDPRIVDEDVEFVFAFFEFIDEGVAPCFRLERPDFEWWGCSCERDSELYPNVRDDVMHRAWSRLVDFVRSLFEEHHLNA